MMDEPPSGPVSQPLSLSLTMTNDPTTSTGSFQRGPAVALVTLLEIYVVFPGCFVLSLFLNFLKKGVFLLIHSTNSL